MNPRTVFKLPAPACVLIVFALLSIAPPFARPAAADRILPFGQVLIVPDDRLLQGGGEDGSSAAENAKADPAGPHRLEFSDGTRLHGTLQALDSERRELVWRRADVSGLLTLPMAQVTRLTLGGSAGRKAAVHATVKLAGGDWLTADVIGAQGSKIQLELGDGSPVTLDRAQVEWIYFSRNSAPECYDGPASLAGWVSGGGWVFRDGALRTSMVSPIGRHFEALPDQVEYLFEINQGGDFNAFTIGLHSDDVMTHEFGSGLIQLMLRGESLRLTAQMGSRMKSEQVDLAKALRAPGELGGGFTLDRNSPVRFRILEDRPGGRLAVFINGRKAAQWNVAPGRAGENRGGIVFRPMMSNPNTEQSLSRVRVIPWDGRVPEDEKAEAGSAETDRVSLVGGDVKEGRLESLLRDKMRLSTGSGLLEISRDRIALLRFSPPKNRPREEPAVGHVRLAQRGEFGVAEVGYRDGRFIMRANFGGELMLAPAAVREVEFTRAGFSAAQQSDVLVFKSGDRLRGFIEKAADGQNLRWRGAESQTLVEIDVARVAGVLFARRAERPAAKCGVVAHFLNGDFLAGDFVTLDKDHLVIDTTPAGQLAIPRAGLHALYFSSDGRPPVRDGATGYETWQRGTHVARRGSWMSQPPATEAQVESSSSRWRYFDGSFTLLAERVQHNAYGGNSAHLGCIFESMPPKAEFSFDVTSRNTAVFFSAQLFYEPDAPGYMLQLHSEGMFVYDMAPRLPGRGMPQQIQFRGKVKGDSRQRRIRVLADRPSGKITILVDDVLMGQFGQKAGERARNLGRGVMLFPQPNVPCTFSNLWVGPWNGRVPDKTAALKPAGPETLLLANGDETQGTIGIVTPEIVQLDCDIGRIELPTQRLAMIDFGGQPIQRTAGARLRLVDLGRLTLRSHRVENHAILCQSDMAGELKIPLAHVQEIALTVPAAAGPGEKHQPKER
ncbi:MAG: hypothetical protein M3463_12045 [Verrucomicrobiota bacterium]|nr:hypothetical protein [Verrucomicrobiota bacterium]